MVDVTYTDNRLQIGAEEVKVQYEIADVLVVDETVIVLEKVPTDLLEEQNVAAFDLGGDHLWDIQPAPDGENGQPYRHIKLDEGRLEANNWNGYKYEVDIKTGEVSQIRWMGK